MTTTDPVQTVLDRLDGWKAVGDRQWLARCPAHDDRNPSLSIGTGNDGCALVKCHAGCATADVLAAMNPPMTKADLFPKGTNPNGQKRERRTSQPAVYQTFELAVAAAERQTQGKHSDTWTYHRADGDEHFRVVRFDPPKAKKQYRPFHHDARGWVMKDPPGKLSLYRLPELLSADTVYHFEGEKCVEAARKLGLTATTSAHGYLSPKKSDWTPLAGKRVLLLPDHDGPGRKYVQTVAGILSSLDPPAMMTIVELPDLEDHGDIVDFIEDRHMNAKDDAAIRAEIEALAEQAPEWEPGRRSVNKVDTDMAAVLSRDEAQRKLRGIFKLGQTIVRAGIDLCCELADFYEGGGFEALGDGDGPLPMSYIGSGLGVTKQRVHQLIEAGRSWRRCVNLVDADIAEDVTERLLRPLAKIDPEQQPKAMASALDIAREDHEADQAQREAVGRKPTRLRLKPKHVRAAVDQILGVQPQPRPTRSRAVRRKLLAGVDADTVAVEGVRRQIAELADAAAVIADVPPDVRTIIHALARHPWSLVR